MTRSPNSRFALGKTFLHLALYLATRIVLNAQSPSPGSIGRPWWEREPLRIIDLVTAFSEMKDFPPAEAAARKAAQGFNVEHLEIMSMKRGLDDRGFFFTSTAAGQQNSDYLRQYLPEAKKQGLRVMIYFNVHWYKTEFGSQHSDWLQVREDGTPLTGVYQTGTDFCVNSPWREWVFQVLRDLCAYSIDGIFFDGPIFFPETCYCRWCQEKFKSAYSTSLPSKKERKGKPFRTLLEFQAGSLRDFLRDSRQVIKSINPQIAFYMNGGVRGGNWATARLNRLLVEEQDILGSEGGFIYGDLLRVPIWKPGVTAKLLETQAPNKPRVIFAAAAHKPWTFSLLPAPELRLLYADSIANGANVWLGITPFELAQPEMKAVTDMNQFVAKNSAYLQQTRSEATTALVWSDTTANFYAGADAQMIDIDRVPQRSEVGNLDAEFSGLAEALLRSQTPFDVIDDVSLDQEDLKRYAAIFLPNVACMSEKSVSHLKEYVRNGGNLFATFETSLYDDTGIRRDDFALAELLGVTDQRKIIGPKRWDFMKPATASPLLAGIQRELLPSPAYHVRVTAKGAQPLLFFTKPLAGVYDGIPELSDDPSLLVNQFGKGKVIYFSGDLGSGIQSFHLAEFFRLIANITRELAPSPVLVEGAPQSLQVVLRSQQEGKRLLLHLLNFTGEMTRPMSRVLPLENARVSLLIQGRIKSVRTLMQPRKLQARTGVGGRVQIVLPRMDEYEVVVIETEN
jgi:hypothetical protein